LITFSYDLTELNLAAQKLIEAAGEEKIWIFQGEMGAGKTTLIKEIARSYGIIDQVSSPTFSIVNEYDNKAMETFYHFDFYRLDDPTEALDIGIEEYFYSGNYCWLEWAEKIASFVPDKFLLIRIQNETQSTRTLTIQHILDAS
jgi:tRNA threonylcarbamoyladenosine biosynthesis protein TsaE